MGAVQELVDAVVEDGSFDATPAQALRWLDERHRQLCARTLCFRKTIELGETVAAQDSYALPDEVVQVMQVTIAGVEYGQARHTDFAAGARGWTWLSGPGGIVGRDDSTAGASLLRIFPKPETGGSAIELYAAVQPPALSVSDDTTLKVPINYRDALVSGAIATGMLRMESRPDIAKPHEEIFNAATTELLKATRSRYRGGRPAEIRVAGINA